MRRKLVFVPLIAVSMVWCTNKKKEPVVKPESRVVLRQDMLNTVKLTDTLLIHESTCRGCAFQESTNFAVVDSMGLLKLQDVITEDRNPPEMDGGSVYKGLVLLPLKTGSTI